MPKILLLLSRYAFESVMMPGQCTNPSMPITPSITQSTFPPADVISGFPSQAYPMKDDSENLIDGM